MTIVIFDIDGTLANIEHRLHHVKNGNKNYTAFAAELHKDTPIKPIVNLLNLLWYKDHTILLVSGRGEESRADTEYWLNAHLNGYHCLYMRPAKDYRKDYIIKKEILSQIRKDYPGEEIAFVVDDRTSVVKMWREQGLICLQCNEWEEEHDVAFKSAKKGLLTLLIGPSGAGKSTFLSVQGILESNKEPPSPITPAPVNTNYYNYPRVCYGINSSQVISSDNLRHQICGDFKDQSKNAQVFAALRALAKARVDNGLDTVIDATNIKRADRMAIMEHIKPTKARYIVIDRPLEQKQTTAGWRGELPFDLVAKHHSTFYSQLKDILAGDNLPNVEVIDLRIN